jgi:hypothetical protein
VGKFMHWIVTCYTLLIDHSYHTTQTCTQHACTRCEFLPPRRPRFCHPWTSCKCCRVPSEAHEGHGIILDMLSNVYSPCCGVLLQGADCVEVMADDLLLAAAIIHPAASGQNYVWSTPGAGPPACFAAWCTTAAVC